MDPSILFFFLSWNQLMENVSLSCSNIFGTIKIIDWMWPNRWIVLNKGDRMDNGWCASKRSGVWINGISFMQYLLTERANAAESMKMGTISREEFELIFPVVTMDRLESRPINRNFEPFTKSLCIKKLLPIISFWSFWGGTWRINEKNSMHFPFNFTRIFSLFWIS